MMRDAKSKVGAKGTKRKMRIPAVVPRIVFGATFIGVIPACVAVACGGKTVDSSSGGLSVALVGYQCTPDTPQYCASVANTAFQCPDGSVLANPSDPQCVPRGSVAGIGFTVAAQIGDAGLDVVDADTDG